MKPRISTVDSPNGGVPTGETSNLRPEVTTASIGQQNKPYENPAKFLNSYETTSNLHFDLVGYFSASIHQPSFCPTIPHSRACHPSPSAPPSRQAVLRKKSSVQVMTL